MSRWQTRVREMGRGQHVDGLRFAAGLLSPDDFGEWRHHGLGLVQRYVPGQPDLRLHVWHDSLDRGVRADGGARHNHRFDLVSRVLVGGVLNEELEVLPHVNGPWSSWTVINASDERGPEQPVLHESGLDVWGTDSRSVGPGQEYYFPKWRFHESHPRHAQWDVPCTVTLVSRHRREKAHAHILSVGQPSHAFAEGHLPAPEVVRDVLAQALAAVLEELEALASG